MPSARFRPSHPLFSLGLQTLRELEVPSGILASGREEIYGCIFGRDSLITSLKLLHAYEKIRDPYLLKLVRKVLRNLGRLQGKSINIESGEEPGKCIHEFRPDNHEHLTKREEKPWYVYPDNSMRNYDSVDATLLFLIASYRYLEVSRDYAFLDKRIPAIRLALHWVLEYSDSNGDGLIDYYFNAERKAGGLVAQNWMDSHETLFHENGQEITYPIAPIEVQGYGYAALRSWALYFRERDSALSRKLDRRADIMKRVFNRTFVHERKQGVRFASAMDGAGRPLLSDRSSMGHLLWASYTDPKTHKRKSILAEKYIPALVKRLLSPNLFERDAGIRTLSRRSKLYEPMSYHNGSIWPHDNSLIIEGLEHFGYHAEAEKVRAALLRAFNHFQTPIELFVYDRQAGYTHYTSPSGQTACKKQAWSAASLLAESLALDPRVAGA